MTTAVTPPYTDPAYSALLNHQFDAQVAGASKAYGKFAAFSALKLKSVSVVTPTAGTSTYTGWNGTATVTATAADTISGIKVSGTVTSTYGPWVLDGAAASFRQIALGTNTGVAAPSAGDGLAMAQGDTFHLVRGTDATAVQVPGVQYQIDPAAAIVK